jgi:hypothetical protein
MDRDSWSPYPVFEPFAHSLSFEISDQPWQPYQQDLQTSTSLSDSFDDQNGQPQCDLSEQPATNDIWHAYESVGAHMVRHPLYSEDDPRSFPSYHARHDAIRRNLRPASSHIDSNTRPPAQYEYDFLAPPMRRRPSASSCGSEACSPEPDTPDVLCCDELDCAASFTGRYRKGNLARHKRLTHKGHEPYLCESARCGRSFKRQDARLKHYRKHHPRLSAKYVPRGPRARPPGGNQDTALRNISSWSETGCGSATGEKSFDLPKNKL